MIPATDFAPIFKGWNVWSVWAKDELDFEFLMVGVSDERRLRIWVEDEVRTHLGSSDVDDPIDLKGSQIEILHGPPEGLEPAAIKEKVQGPIMLLDGKATLHYVRNIQRQVQAEIDQAEYEAVRKLDLERAKMKSVTWFIVLGILGYFVTPWLSLSLFLLWLIPKSALFWFEKHLPSGDPNLNYIEFMFGFK